MKKSPAETMSHAADFGGGIHRNQRKRGAGLKLG
jgi:hypothetical protein